MNIKNNDIQSNYKINLGGYTHSGKTAFYNRIFNNKFDPNTPTTARMAFSLKNRRISNISLSFYIWDSIRWASKYDSTVKNFLNESKGILLLFALNARQSFLSLDQCLNIIKGMNMNLLNVPILLLGTHADL